MNFFVFCIPRPGNRSARHLVSVILTPRGRPATLTVLDRQQCLRPLAKLQIPSHFQNLPRSPGLKVSDSQTLRF
jgi:hypothetical protein